MHNGMRYVCALVSALFIVTESARTSPSSGEPCDAILFEEGSQKLKATSQAFFAAPCAATLETAMGAAGDLLAEMLDANREELEAANPTLLAQWSGAFETCYHTKYATLKQDMSDGNLYPDAFVHKYCAGTTMGQALGVMVALQRGENVVPEARLTSARFFILVAHLEKMGAVPFQTFFENTLERQIAPMLEGAARRFDQADERSAWTTLTGFDTLEGVDRMVWIELKSLPMGLKSLFLACGQDKTHPEFIQRVARLKNKNIVPIATGGAYPDELESIAQGWQDLMAMDKATVDNSRAALSGLLKECTEGDTSATKAQLEACVAKYTRDRTRLGEVMCFFWQVEQRLFDVLYSERVAAAESQPSLYAPLQEAWGKETAAAALLAGYKQVLHQRSVLTIGEVRTLLGRNLLEDAQEEDDA